MEGLIFIGATFVVFWLLFIRPQQRRVREHRELVVALAEGDEVMLTSGLYGTIDRLEDDVVHLEVAPGTTVKVARGAVAKRAHEVLGTPAPEEGPEIFEGPDLDDQTGDAL